MALLKSRKVQFKHRFFKHENSGKVFRLIGVSNVSAREFKRKAWPVEAVYVDESGELWTCSIEKFNEKLVEINPATGQKID